MNKRNLIIWLGLSAAAGAAAGLVTNPRQQAAASVVGAGAGLIAGTVAALILDRLGAGKDDGVAYYSSVSPYYEEFEDIKQ